MLKSRVTKTSYHHGDLRQSLLDNALTLIKRDGIEKLSLRKLAETVGVSQTAIYHHFTDKQNLLYELGRQGTDALTSTIKPALIDENMPLQDRLAFAVHAYVHFAISNPEQYELMLGRTTWKQTTESDFHRDGRKSFRAYGKLIAHLQQQGVLKADVNPLRVAQVSWATLHGICRMYNDGLAFKPEDIDEISRYALKMMLQALGLPEKE